MMDITAFIKNATSEFPQLATAKPWHVIRDIVSSLEAIVKGLGQEYLIKGNVAIHRTASVEEHVILKGPIIIGPHVFIGAHAYLRGGVFLSNRVSVGPGCEIKSSIICSQSALAHFNFVGDSIIGSDVNMEAGSVIANHHNDREDKTIRVAVKGEVVALDVIKFGAIVGDGCKIGANAVLCPGSVLEARTVVGRLQLIEQDRR
jgi:bifunctional N-acetylglucosamine-1-phosphate-uridyltransferase/glucosamine-1-phosphate-acetyltransferase GlmU-like protein